ncbi:biogenesis of lysosome-related organelles complex 1 subunit 1 [Narcine bancroftii]|uniref:biogenesis of lysosome-related organelles complex 1 subunit 1 n=1 Tax=Narcine bancroftii TaxID=1343680 RepID=UPI00383196C4
MTAVLARSATQFLLAGRTWSGAALVPTELSVMLSRLLKDHQAKQNERKELQEKRRKEAVAAATCLTEALVDHLNVGVAQAYMNQRKLDNEVKTLQIQAAQFAKQTQQWLGMVDNFNQALKEIGDVENWARSIEMDMRTIATALEYVYKGQLQPAT